MSTGLMITGAVSILAGFGLAVVEMILPGFGFPGIAGGILMIAGIGLLHLPLATSLLLAVVIAALLVAAFFAVARSAEKGRLSKSRLILKDSFQQTEKALCKVGDTGIAQTVLRPAGIAELNGERLNVVSEGDFIAKGEKIRVLSVDGNRICVEKVS